MTGVSAWLNTRPPFVRWMMLFVFGAFAALGQAPWGIWPLTLLGLAGAMLILTGPMRLRAAFGGGWLLGLGYFAIALHWIVEPFLVDFDRYGWMAPFGLFFMAAGGGVFWGLGSVLARALGRGAVAPCTLAIGLLCAEMARSFLFTGFPWALIGHVAIDTFVVQHAALFGPHVLTMVVLTFAGTLALGQWLRFAGLAAVLFAVTLTFDDPQTDEDAPLVRIIQPNAPQHLKWEPGYAEQFYERSLALTGGEGDLDVIVWPETSVPFYINTMPEAFARIGDAAGGVPVVVGGLRSEAYGFYNTLAVIGSDGVIGDRYDKSHLVPFGEYIPFEGVLAQFGLFDLTEGWMYGRGDGIALVEIPGIGAALPAICYEYIFAEEINATEGQARLMVFITNDAWFGNWAGPAQHFAQARLRAIEQGVPVVRSANTGISGVIDAKGRVIGTLALNTEGALDLPLPPAIDPPPYTIWGDWPVAALTVLLALAATLRAGRKAIDPAGVAS